MSTPTKVYVVTAGSYSDYRIEAVYLSKEDAEEHVRRFTADDPIYDIGFNPIEEFDVGPVPPALWYCAKAYRDGRIETEKLCAPTTRQKWRDARVQWWSVVGSEHALAHGETAEEAAKIASERRKQLLALDALREQQGELRARKPAPKKWSGWNT